MLLALHLSMQKRKLEKPSLFESCAPLKLLTGTLLSCLLTITGSAEILDPANLDICNCLDKRNEVLPLCESDSDPSCNTDNQTVAVVDELTKTPQELEAEFFSKLTYCETRLYHFIAGTKDFIPAKCQEETIKRFEQGSYQPTALWGMYTVRTSSYPYRTFTVLELRQRTKGPYRHVLQADRNSRARIIGWKRHHQFPYTYMNGDVQAQIDNLPETPFPTEVLDFAVGITPFLGTADLFSRGEILEGSLSLAGDLLWGLRILDKVSKVAVGATKLDKVSRVTVISAGVAADTTMVTRYGYKLFNEGLTGFEAGDASLSILNLILEAKGYRIKDRISSAMRRTVFRRPKVKKPAECDRVKPEEAPVCDNRFPDNDDPIWNEIEGKEPGPGELEADQLEAIDEALELIENRNKLRIVPYRRANLQYPLDHGGKRKYTLNELNRLIPSLRSDYSLADTVDALAPEQLKELTPTTLVRRDDKLNLTKADRPKAHLDEYDCHSYLMPARIEGVEVRPYAGNNKTYLHYVDPLRHLIQKGQRGNVRWPQHSPFISMSDPTHLPNGIVGFGDKTIEFDLHRYLDDLASGATKHKLDILTGDQLDRYILEVKIKPFFVDNNIPQSVQSQALAEAYRLGQLQRAQGGGALKSHEFKKLKQLFQPYLDNKNSALTTFLPLVHRIGNDEIMVLGAVPGRYVTIRPDNV